MRTLPRQEQWKFQRAIEIFHKANGPSYENAPKKLQGFLGAFSTINHGTVYKTRSGRCLILF